MWYKNMVTDTVECENHGEGRKPDISRLDWIRVKWGRRGIFKIICSFNKLIHLYFIIIIVKNNTNTDLIIKVEYMSMSVCVCVLCLPHRVNMLCFARHGLNPFEVKCV